MEYKLATRQQAAALFDRFYPIQHVIPESLLGSEKPVTDDQKVVALEKLNQAFVACVPEHEFSTAELQGYLLSCKMMPEKAAKGVEAWVADERRQKEEKQMRIDAKKRKLKERMDKMEVEKLQSTLAKVGGGIGIHGTEEKKPLDLPPPPPTVTMRVNGTNRVDMIVGTADL